MDNKWNITIKNFDGFAPAYYKNTYSFYGNKGHANDMNNVDLLDPNCLCPAPKATDLTGGTQAGELGSVLITSILKHAVSDGITYACGANKVFKITPTAVSNGSFPLTITGGAHQVADSLLYYKSKVYVFWNDTGTEGEIAQITLPSTIDVDWGSTTPATGAGHLEDAPHYGIVGGNDRMYITNGKYIASYKGSTDVLTVHALDFFDNSEVISLSWNNNRIIAGVNRPNISGSNFNQSAIYRWNGISSSWEGDPIEVSGKIGALYTKNGRTFVWWKEGISTGGYSFGYVNGSILSTIKTYKGSLPNQNQVGEYEGHIAWLSSNEVLLWGSKDIEIPVKLFQYASPKQTTAGAFASPFGDLLISSYAGANYSMAKMGNYTKTSDYTFIALDMAQAGLLSYIDLIQVKTKQLASGAKCDFTLYYNDAKSSKALTQIAYLASLPTIHKILNKSIQCEDLQLKVSHANGSESNPVSIKSIYLAGHYIPNK